MPIADFTYEPTFSWERRGAGTGNPTGISYVDNLANFGRPAAAAPIDPVAAVGAPSWVAQNPFAAPGGVTSTAYNANPTPTSGAGAFGAVPGQLGLPDPAKDLGAQVPNLSGLNSAASGDILSLLSGELSPDVQAQIQDAAARFGVTSGMPGSGLVSNRTARDFGLTSMQLKQQGLAALNPYLAQTASTQVLNPALKTSIAETNALNAAAPDPTKAASYAKSLFDQYLASTQGRGTQVRTGGSGYSGGGPGGGYGAIPQVTGNYRGGGSSGYDANGYPISSYLPGAFPGTNGGAIPQAQNTGYTGGYTGYNPNVLPNGGARYYGDPGVFGNTDYDILYDWGNNDFSG